MAKITQYTDGGTIQDADYFVSARSGQNYKNLWSTFKSTLKTYFDTLYDATGAATMPRGHLWGLTLSNNAGDATNDIDIAAGEARDSTDAVDMTLASALTKQLDVNWAVGTNQGGLDTGAIANTTYHVWLIKRSDTGVVDVLFSTSATAPTMPASYGYKRRIGSIKRVSGALQLFTQRGDDFILSTPVKDYDVNTQSTSSVTYALASVPSGIVVKAKVEITAYRTGAASQMYIRALTSADVAPSLYVTGQGNWNDPSSGLGEEAGFEIYTDTSAQIAVRASAAMAQLVITVHGWVDTRGRLA